MTGLILAGGRSRRFGTDKAAYVFDGRSMFARVHDAAAPLVREMLVSVGSPRALRPAWNECCGR